MDIIITYHPGKDTEWISTLPEGAKGLNAGRIIEVKVIVSRYVTVTIGNYRLKTTYHMRDSGVRFPL